MGKQPVKYYVVDAFTDEAFEGNPAAVCILEEEKDEKWMQAVAMEFNISQTCYLTRITDSAEVASSPRFHLRWFTPAAEVKLCGHATLATAYILFSKGFVKSSTIEFVTASGILTAKKVPEIKKTNSSGDQNGEAQESYLIELNFPTVATIECNDVDLVLVSKALGGADIVDLRRIIPTDDLFVVLQSSKAVAELQPQLDEMLKCPGRGITVSAVAPPDSGFDTYSRSFYPKMGIKEDPVCGSAHCAVIPYWSKKLGKCDFKAYAASSRSGILYIHLDEQSQRVLLRGKAVAVMEGSIFV
ncbi:hypothetical protein Tsubulata_041301 [Turnera subulata]|uniref:Uncharacterized protein n=1 Tax=Turnera subulata TaxID=218843 RepID=A0A9Q0JL37_9ROSI|nr:hypothetical protein Tsubulata_041300 [Turnera subulata]KAJ4845625.1 hypothetical protein Tsubulata_041301 [Turnera subulata]